MYAVTFLLLVPDIRILQNFAYLFFGYLGLVDAATGWMLAAMVGGVLWAGAAAANLPPRDVPHLADAARERAPHDPTMSWARPVTVAAACSPSRTRWSASAGRSACRSAFPPR